LLKRFENGDGLAVFTFSKNHHQWGFFGLLSYHDTLKLIKHIIWWIDIKRQVRKLSLTSKVFDRFLSYNKVYLMIDTKIQKKYCHAKIII